MADIYTRSQATATRLLTDFKQGTIVHSRPGAPTGPEWDPQPGTPTETTVPGGTVRGISAKLVGEQLRSGTMIAASDLVVTLPVFGITPVMTDQIIIDGTARAILQIDQVPPAGTVVVWRLYVR